MEQPDLSPAKSKRSPVYLGSAHQPAVLPRLLREASLPCTAVSTAPEQTHHLPRARCFERDDL